MKQKLFLMLFALVLSITAVAQETIFPAKLMAPVEFNRGKVHISVLRGEAFYQEEGKPKQLLRKGDVVTTAPNVRHWNGATPWSDCECMTISDLVPGEEHAVQLKKVTDEEFTSPIKYETRL